MAVILADIETQPTGRVIQFPRDDFTPPERVGTPELCRILISEWRRKHQGVDSVEVAGESSDLDALASSLCDDSGVETVNRNIDLAPLDAASEPQASAIGLSAMTTTADLRSGVLMSELSPKLLTDAERQASDSTNGRLARLLAKGLR